MPGAPFCRRTVPCIRGHLALVELVELPQYSMVENNFEGNFVGNFVRSFVDFVGNWKTVRHTLDCSPQAEEAAQVELRKCLFAFFGC